MNECRDCKYFKLDPQNVSQGACHKNPPTVFMMMVQQGVGAHPVFTSAWPPVQAKQGCGEWVEKEKRAGVVQ